jgi:hypothetical protein
MTAELFIDKFGQGDAVFIYDQGMVIDVLLHLSKNASFLSTPTTFCVG